MSQKAKVILEEGGEPPVKLCVLSSNVTKQMLYTCKYCGAWDWLSRIIQKTYEEEKRCRRCNEVLALEVYTLNDMEKVMRPVEPPDQMK